MLTRMLLTLRATFRFCLMTKQWQYIVVVVASKAANEGL